MFPRTTGLMTCYFMIIDTVRRKTNAFQYRLGQFFASGTAAMIGFWIIWPFETLKNMA